MLVLYFVVSSAWAHDTNLSYIRIWAAPDAWEMEVVLNAAVTDSFLAGRFNGGNTEKLFAELAGEATALFRVSSDGTPLKADSAEFHLVGDEGVYTVRYPRTGNGHLELTHHFPERMIPGNGTIIKTVYADGSPGKSVFVSADHPTESVALLKETDPVPVAETDAPEEAPAVQKSPKPDQDLSWFPPVFFKLGVEHIAFGFDHLLFLAGLLVACRKPNDIFAIVTSFTLAHSITLSVAALDLWVPPSSIVEPAIAASIVFVGVENMLRKDIGKERALLTFAFGLIHGFGFAGVLRDLGLGQDGNSIVGPLLAFNVGIEAGQLSIVALVLPGLLWLQHANEHARRWLKPTLSILIALTGLYWLLQRTVFAG